MARPKKIIKTLTELPAQFKHKAQNANGEWWAYTGKAKVHEEWQVWHPVGKCKGMFIGMGNPNPDWRDTWQPVYEYEEA